MAKPSGKVARLARRKRSVRKRVSGTIERPRLAVYRSARHIYAQIIDDTAGQTLASASSVQLKIGGGNSEAAKEVGKALAERAKAASVTTVQFDRGGRLFHGRVKALADAAREAGLEF
ncbi:MAG: 50S ribosomal protein L18 [bacterium]|nr:50S ribosomal protein L18 [bacterium]